MNVVLYSNKSTDFHYVFPSFLLVIVALTKARIQALRVLFLLQSQGWEDRAMSGHISRILPHL